jgi:hypothetical protein
MKSLGGGLADPAMKRRREAEVSLPPHDFKPYTPGRRWRRPSLGIPATYFKWGHKSGRVDTCRRLWQHLDEEGRRLAAEIALEGDADD